VVRGDNLWTIARDRLAEVCRRAADLSDRDIAAYGVRVIEANRGGLLSGDPDLITLVAADLPDQQTMAISWALSHGIQHRSRSRQPSRQPLLEQGRRRALLVLEPSRIGWQDRPAG
jgi:hypothetical protein